MQLIKALYQRGFKPTKAAASLRGNIDFLLSEQDTYSEKVAVLDQSVFDALKVLYPKNKNIVAIATEHQIEQAQINNDGFNTQLPDTPVELTYKNGGAFEQGADYVVLGKHIKKIMSTVQAYELLDSDEELNGSMWSAGGCYPLALAIQKVLGMGELKMIVDNGIVQHIMWNKGKIYIDSDGMGPAYKKIAIYKLEMPHFKNPEIVDFDKNKADNSTIGKGGPGFIDKIAAFIKSKMPNSFADGGIILYHGSDTAFDQFDEARQSTGDSSDLFGKGFYLTNNEKVADYYAHQIAKKSFIKGYNNQGVFGTELPIYEKDADAKAANKKIVNKFIVNGKILNAEIFIIDNDFKKAIIDSWVKHSGMDAEDAERTFEIMNNIKPKIFNFRGELQYILQHIAFADSRIKDDIIDYIKSLGYDVVKYPSDKNYEGDGSYNYVIYNKDVIKKAFEKGGQIVQPKISNFYIRPHEEILSESEIIQEHAKNPGSVIEILSGDYPIYFFADKDDQKNQLIYYIQVGSADPLEFDNYNDALFKFDEIIAEYSSGKVELKEPTNADFKFKRASNIFPEPKKSVNFSTLFQADNYITQKKADQLVLSWKNYAKKIGEVEDHSKEVIISIFDASGVWSQPYEDAGYTVIRYDLYRGDDVMRENWIELRAKINASGKKVVGILTAPPCTSFAGSGARWWDVQHDVASKEWVLKKYGTFAAQYFDKPLDYAIALVNQVRIAVEFLNPSLFYTAENPVGRIQQKAKLPEPTLIFQPNNFGDPYTKKTLIWGVMNPNLPTANVFPSKGSKIHKLWGTNKAAKKERSQTPEGFAYAFFMANNTSKLKFTSKDTYEQGGEIDQKQETYQKWKGLVNMSKGELEKFYNSDEGKAAGISTDTAKKLGISRGRTSAKWIMKMKETPVKQWTPEMWKWANKQISFISRMKGNKGDLYDDKGQKTRKHTSLLIWGHNPQKEYESGGEVLLAPNGQKSNLTPAQWHTVRTPEFKAWFGEWEKDPANASKVVDENGEPLVVYHGSNSRFNVFKKSKNTGTHGEKDQLEGIYFTDNKEVAQWYTNFTSEEFVKNVFLNIKKPFRTENIKRLKEEFNSNFLFGLSKKINRHGYDGILLEAGFDTLGEQKLYLAFEPNQVKSATDNIGQFNSKNSDIRFEDGGNLPDDDQIPDTLYKGYEARVQANMQYIGSQLSDWTAVKIKGFSPQPGPNGKTIDMPEFDFPIGYKPSKTLYKSSNDNLCCELCGHTPIKTVYWIQNNKEKTTLSVGSECVQNVGDKKTGKEHLRDLKLNLAKVLDNDLKNLAKIVSANFSKLRKESYGYGSKQFREWKTFYIGNNPDYNNARIYEQIKNIDTAILINQKEAEKKKAYYRSQPYLYNDFINSIDWKYVYAIIPVFDWDKEQMLVNQKYLSIESAEKLLLTWFKKNEQIAKQLIETIVKIIPILKPDIEFDFNSKYLDAIDTTPKEVTEFVRGGNLVRRNRFSGYKGFDRIGREAKSRLKQMAQSQAASEPTERKKIYWLTFKDNSTESPLVISKFYLKMENGNVKPSDTFNPSACWVSAYINTGEDVDDVKTNTWVISDYTIIKDEKGNVLKTYN